MTVEYKVVERGNPANPSAPKKFYPLISSSGRTTMRQLAGRISQISTVSSTDTMAVLEGLLTIIPEELAKGNIVELGDFGNFWLKINAEGAESADVVRGTQVTNVAPRFNPGREFKKALSSVTFTKA